MMGIRGSFIGPVWVQKMRIAWRRMGEPLLGSISRRQETLFAIIMEFWEFWFRNVFGNDHSHYDSVKMNE